jgi:hypothetical protein
VEVRKDQAGITGSMMVMRYWFGRIPVRWIFVTDEFSVQQRHSSVSDSEISVDTKSIDFVMDHGFREPLPFSRPLF